MPLTEETLNYNRIQRAAGSKIFDRGLVYYHQKRVSIETVDEEIATCLVRGSSSDYEVGIEMEGNSLFFSCECPYAEGGVICKHEVAAALALRDYLRTHTPPNWRSQLTRMVQGTLPNARTTPQPYLLLFSLHSLYDYGNTSWKLTPYMLPVRAIPEEARALIDTLPAARLGELVLSIPDLSMALKTPYNALNPISCLNVSRQVVSLANYLIDKSKYYTYAPVAGADLALLSGLDVTLFSGSQAVPIQRVLEFLPQQGLLQLNAERTPEGIRLKLRVTVGDQTLTYKKGETQIVSRNPMWLLTEQYLYELEGEFPDYLLMNLIETPELLIPKKDEAEFLEKYYLPLAKVLPVQGDAVTWQEVKAEPVKRLYLSDTVSPPLVGVRTDGTGDPRLDFERRPNTDRGRPSNPRGRGSSTAGLQAQLRIGYGEYEVPYQSGLPLQHIQSLPDTWTLVRISRDAEFEREAFDSLASAEMGLKRAPSPAPAGNFLLRAKIHPVDFLMRHVPRLLAKGFEIYGEEKLRIGRVNRNTPTISFNISSGIDWFDVKAVVNYGELEVSFKDIRRALRKKEHYIKLADGTIGQIPMEWIERYKHLFALGEETEQGVRLSNHHVTLIDQLLGEADRVRTDAEFKHRSQLLRNFSGIAAKDLPKGFVGELRPYQKAGYDWLHFLHEYGFGGCLADDMGLGKTIQALVFFQSLRESAHPKTASLLVLPKSLLFNWQREAARFTPELRLCEYSKNDRNKDTALFTQYDLIITTYGVMLRDIETLRQYRFHYVLLDESQAIKNPVAQSAKAARLLNAEHRLVLTGTPVENSTYELWSQFAFLNPGLLGNIEYFKEEFGTPIEKRGEEQAAQFLRKMVFPFILRRTKDQVAPELPPRTERLLFSDMEPAQRKLYNRTRDYYRGMLIGMIEREGINDARMKILEGLLRLRQICNHPKLMDDQFHGESAKFELLLETLETLRVEGHKALVFSQFVEMLKLVRRELDLRHIPYTYLDGQTRNRQERVDTFQNEPKIPFFLISLKAGGVGLNLTAADYVIHIDPWWNPAVEMQATDRTHRIGQEKPVFVYKLIVRDSVEEKILQLQERKKNLVDQLITTDSSFFKSLSTEDVKVLFG
jgi:non-specific serine/threonine protein kinase